MDTENAVRLLEVLVSGGVSELVFAGGDPSLRTDLGDLLRIAHDLKLGTEVQTNAHTRRADFPVQLERADLVGLSIDADTAAAHDAFRGRASNFDRVIELAETLERRAQPFVVRTVVSRVNQDQLTELGPLLGRFKFLRRWSLVQFTPIGDGFVNRLRYEIPDDDFQRFAWAAAERYPGEAEVNVYPNAHKSGVYFIIGPSGDVHGRVDGGAMETYPVVGNLLRDRLEDVVDRLDFRPDAHARRYRGLLTPTTDDGDPEPQV